MAPAQKARRQAILALAMALTLCAGVVGAGCQSSDAAGDGGKQLAQTGASPDRAAEEAAPDTRLTFTVELEGSEFQDAPLVVQVEGEGADGKDFARQYRAIPGHVYDLNVEAGTYRFALAADAPYDDAYLCVPATASCAYDGQKGQEVKLRTSVDREAMEAAVQAKAAEEARLAEEARAAEEARLAEKARAAEEARAAEAAAAAAAEAEAQRKAQEEAVAAQKNTRTVYITRTGKKYHSGGCQHLSKSKIPIDYDDARAQGYGPCGTCKPG